MEAPMRYFKYDGPMVDIELLKKRHQELSEDAQHKDCPALELRCGELTFLLDQKARMFITKQLPGFHA
jgi:hypothetical protein